jgi:glycosyltransferase involved in cell wall biosynthesis
MGYVGNLYKGKGIKIILEIAAKMPDIDFHIVGGTKKDILHWQTYIKSHNIHFHGFVDQSKVSTYINSFDICLLPNQKILTSFLSHKNNVDKISYGDVTSPLKMFQYMAHKKPIIASDLPVLREVLNEQNAFLVPPDDINAWINAIKLLKDNNDLRETIANNAYQDFINNYTWVKRAEKVLM